MNIQEYARIRLEDTAELEAFFADPRWGAEAAKLEAEPEFDSKTFRRLLNAYADSPAGPFGKRRLALYQQAHLLFDELLSDGFAAHGYELKDSFIGGSEADLIMLTSSHAGMTQEQIAHDVLMCSKNAVGERRSRLRDGIRIGDMCVSAEFGYRGEFRSSAHPVSLPLNLSEVYVLLCALKSYSEGRSENDPHHAIAERLAGMVHGELSGYATSKLEPRFAERGWGFEDVDPVFRADTPAPTSPFRQQRWEASPADWTYFEKAQIPVVVTLANGKTLEGAILPEPLAEPFLANRKDKRACCVLRCSNGDCRTVPWADIVCIEQVR